MRETPILFSTPMIRALLNTKPDTWPADPIDTSKPFKYMTRRVVKPQPENPSRLIVEYGKLKDIWRGAGMIWQSETLGKPPYIKGDILWVRETFTKASNGDCIYRADPIFDGCGEGDISWAWTPSIYMPREAARIFLEVKAVKVERVQEITEEDAKAEGVKATMNCGTKPEFKNPLCIELNNSCCVHAFADLWETLNAKRGYSWESNPYVYVYEFMRVK